MSDAELDAPDEESVPMTMSERLVWAYLGTVLVTSGVYLAVMAARLADGPVAQVAWVGPMLWTIGISVGATVVLTIAGTIAGAIAGEIAGAAGRRRGGARDRAAGADLALSTVPDARDRDIDLRADRALVGVLGVGFVAALVLAMVEADTFWIGNALFVAGTIGAVVESTTKIRLYRRGF